MISGKKKLFIIVSRLVRTGKLINLIRATVRMQHITGYDDDTLKDFHNDFAIFLLEFHNPQLIIRMHKNEKLESWIISCIRRELTSSGTYFFRKYRRYYTINIPLDKMCSNCVEY